MESSMKTLRQLALRHPETSEGIACEGTALESRTIKVRKKAFLFLRAGTAMVKLRDSLPEARKIAAKDPDRCKAGGTGWVTAATDLPLAVLKRWVGESYKLMAPKPRR